MLYDSTSTKFKSRHITRLAGYGPWGRKLYTTEQLSPAEQNTRHLG